MKRFRSPVKTQQHLQIQIMRRQRASVLQPH
jgi:hypothetical protein